MPTLRFKRGRGSAFGLFRSDYDVKILYSSIRKIVIVEYDHQPDNRNRQEDADQSADLRSGQNGDDHHQRMHLDSAADDSRIDDVVLEDAKYDKEQQDKQRLVEGHCQGQTEDDAYRDQRTNQRNEFKQP